MSYRLVEISNLINLHIREVCGRQGYEFKDAVLDEFLHTYGVAYFAALLAYRRGLDIELAGIIGLLHDAGRIIDGLMDDRHSLASAELASRILQQANTFNEEEIATVCEALRTHSDKEVIGSEYQEIIKDADAFERVISMNNWGKPRSLRRQRLGGVMQTLRLQYWEDEEAD